MINPHKSPTGQLFALDAMQAFLEAARWLELVIVDESFIDFAGEEIPSLLHAAERYPNLVIVRSMSKTLRRSWLAPGLLLQRQFRASSTFCAGRCPTWI